MSLHNNQHAITTYRSLSLHNNQHAITTYRPLPHVTE